MSDLEKLSNVLNSNLSPDKWEFFYNYARRSLDEDIERFYKIDEKAGKFLTLVSVVFGLFAAITSWFLEKYCPLDGITSWLLFIAMILTFLALISSWSLLFRSIKLTKTPRMPLTNEMEKMIWEKKFPDIYYALTKTCKVALDGNKVIINIKGDLLKKAYVDISLAAWLIAVDIFLILILEFS